MYLKKLQLKLLLKLLPQHHKVCFLTYKHDFCFFPSNPKNQQLIFGLENVGTQEDQIMIEQPTTGPQEEDMRIEIPGLSSFFVFFSVFERWQLRAP